MATGQDESVRLVWSAPANNGGSPIVEYDLESAPDSAPDDFSRLAGLDAALNEAVIPAINGEYFYYRLRARNIAAVSPPSAPLRAAAGAPPSAPRGFAIGVARSELTLQWQAPINNRGFSITAYLAYYRQEAPSAVFGVHTLAASARQFVLSLTAGAAYSVSIAAVNERGVGERAALFELTGEPSTAPVSLSAGFNPQNSANLISLAWASPTDSGGWSITAIVAEVFGAGGSVAQTLAGGASVANYTAMAKGHVYTVRARALTRFASGQAALFTLSLYQTIPAAVANFVFAQAVDRQLAATWNAPPSAGGASITAHYLSYIVDGGQTTRLALAAAALGQTLTALAQGASVSVVVFAANAVGEGDSVAAARRVWLPPSSLTLLTVRRDNPLGVAVSRLFYEYTVNDGGGPITDHILTYRLQEWGPTAAFVRRTPHSIDSYPGGRYIATIQMTDGFNKNFEFLLSLQNGAGFSNPVSFSYHSPPGPPSGLFISVLFKGDRLVTLAWGAADNGGSTVTRWRVWLQAPQGVGNVLTIFPGSVTIAALSTGLQNNVRYDVLLQAANAYDNGDFSAQTQGNLSFVLAGAPGTVSVFTRDWQSNWVGQGAQQPGLSLFWGAPANNGGNAITGYVIEHFHFVREIFGSATTGWSVIARVAGESSTSAFLPAANIPALGWQNAHRFRIYARNVATRNGDMVTLAYDMVTTGFFLNITNGIMLGHRPDKARGFSLTRTPANNVVAHITFDRPLHPGDSNAANIGYLIRGYRLYDSETGPSLATPAHDIRVEKSEYASFHNWQYDPATFPR